MLTPSEKTIFDTGRIGRCTCALLTMDSSLNVSWGMVIVLTGSLFLIHQQPHLSVEKQQTQLLIQQLDHSHLLELNESRSSKRRRSLNCPTSH
jgi:hypothetical protein